MSGIGMLFSRLWIHDAKFCSLQVVSLLLFSYNYALELSSGTVKEKYVASSTSLFVVENIPLSFFA